MKLSKRLETLERGRVCPANDERRDRATWQSIIKIYGDGHTLASDEPVPTLADLLQSIDEVYA